MYISPNLPLIYHLKNILEQQEIACVLMNVYSQGGAGELPPDQVWPQLWILDDDQLESARLLIQAQLRPVPHGNAWSCNQCGELIEAQFTDCWQCGCSKVDSP